MWFKMPKGCRTISVEQQSFGIEATDDDGMNYFRAPDHFAAKILALPGFAQGEPPEGSPDDLPRADPLRDGAIAQLTAELIASRRDAQELRSDLIAAQSSVTALTHENTGLKQELETARGHVAGLQEKLEDAGIDEVVPLQQKKGGLK